MWSDREAYGTMVLAFTDDPAAHRAALAQRRPSADDMRNRVRIAPQQAPTADEARDMATAIATVAGASQICLDSTLVAARPEPPAPGTPLEVIEPAGTDGSYPPDTDVECGGVRFALGDLQSMTPIEQADPGLQAVVTSWIDGPAGESLPTDGWAVLNETDEAATIVRIAEGALMVIGAEMGRTGWIWAGGSGGGPCDERRELPPGLGQVDWVLDPALPLPDATSTELHLLATERACTGASELGDRLLGPQVVESADTVRIAFAAIPLTGAQTCPGNPPTAVTITLERPLGARTLLDGRHIGSLQEVIASHGN
jgi:hypothetical protein